MIEHIFTDIFQTDNFTALFEQTKVSNAYIIIYNDFNILILILITKKQNLSAINRAIKDKINDINSVVNNTNTSIDDDDNDDDITLSTITNINTTNNNQLKSSTNTTNLKLNSINDTKNNNKGNSKIITDVSNQISYLDNFNKKNKF